MSAISKESISHFQNFKDLQHPRLNDRFTHGTRYPIKLLRYFSESPPDNLGFRYNTQPASLKVRFLKEKLAFIVGLFKCPRYFITNKFCSPANTPTPRVCTFSLKYDLVIFAWHWCRSLQSYRHKRKSDKPAIKHAI